MTRKLRAVLVLLVLALVGTACPARQRTPVRRYEERKPRHASHPHAHRHPHGRHAHHHHPHVHPHIGGDDGHHHAH